MVRVIVLSFLITQVLSSSGLPGGSTSDRLCVTMRIEKDDSRHGPRSPIEWFLVCAVFVLRWRLVEKGTEFVAEGDLGLG
jgi:hypothetical protein